jgi:hypothetical protein
LGDGEQQREQLAVGGEGVAEVGRETPRTLLEVEARPEEDRRWRSMAVSSWRKKWSGMELYPGDVVNGSSSKVLLHLQRKTAVRFISSDGDGGGRWWHSTASRAVGGGEQSRAKAGY